METYHAIVQRILRDGTPKSDRTGTGTRSISGMQFVHDMRTGFPLLTTKRTPFRVIAVELDGFIHGITDKRWYQERNCTIWDEWANPRKAPYGTDEASKAQMLAERDLGPIYGFLWRHWNAPYEGHETNYQGRGIDQLQQAIDRLRRDPSDRRALVSAWDPSQLPQQSLPPCHYGFQLLARPTENGGHALDLIWQQRSVDTMLGLPFNIASYGLLLHLVAKLLGMEEGRLVGQLGDTHIYQNHFAGAEEFLTRSPTRYPLPQIETDPIASLDDWNATRSKVLNYESYPKIEFPIAV